MIDKHFSRGYYQVDKKIYLQKISALIEGTKTNVHPEWIFNDEVFGAVDWSVEPTESITDLYKERAQQLRKKYDYLVLLYSGGADSHNILETFAKNNIKLDEVVVSWQSSLSGTYTPDSTNYDWTNYNSEWTFAIKPRLEWFSSQCPDTKISIYDWAQGIDKVKIEDDFILNRNQNHMIYGEQRWSFDKVEPIRRIREREKNVGVLSGIDKPRICFHENKYKLYFLDTIAYGPSTDQPLDLLGDNLSIELFYWSPDSIKILQKQAHLMIKFLELVPSFQKYITWPISNPMYRQWYETSSRAILYPTLDLSVFQAAKSPEFTIGYDQLLYSIGFKDRIVTQQTENFAYLKTIIDSKYFKETNNGVPIIAPFISRMYELTK